MKAAALEIHCHESKLTLCSKLDGSISVSRLGLALLSKLRQILDDDKKCTTAFAVDSVETRYQIVAQYFTITHFISILLGRYVNALFGVATLLSPFNLERRLKRLIPHISACI